MTSAGSSSIRDVPPCCLTHCHESGNKPGTELPHDIDVHRERYGELMKQNSRDLAHAGFYLCAIIVVVGALSLGISALSQALASSSAFQSIATLLDGDADAEQSRTRLEVVVGNAREIRAALARPTPPREALPPITAKLASGSLRKGVSPVAVSPTTVRAVTKITVNKLPRAAQDAMAMDTSSAKRVAAPQVELHKVY